MSFGKSGIVDCMICHGKVFSLVLRSVMDKCQAMSLLGSSRGDLILQQWSHSYEFGWSFVSTSFFFFWRLIGCKIYSCYSIVLYHINERKPFNKNKINVFSISSFSNHPYHIGLTEDVCVVSNFCIYSVSFQLMKTDGLWLSKY